MDSWQGMTILFVVGIVKRVPHSVQRGTVQSLGWLLIPCTREGFTLTFPPGSRPNKGSTLSYMFCLSPNKIGLIKDRASI